MIKCVVIILSTMTGEISEVTYHADSCQAIYAMVERKAADTKYEVLGVYEG